MLWYSVGRTQDFPISSGVSEMTNSTYARYAPYYSILCAFGTWFKLALPTTGLGIYASFDYFPNRPWSGGTWFYLTSANFATNFLYFTTTNTNLISDVYVNGSKIGSIALSGIAISQIEVRLMLDASVGIVQIWVNGELIINYNGNTGTTTTPIGGVFWTSGGNNNFNISNVVISDNPIGNKIPIFLPMVDTATVAAGVQLATPGTEYLADVVDLPTLPVVAKVTSVRITAQIISGDGVSNADWELNVDGTTTAVTQSLPTTSAYKSAQIEGNWTPAQINGAKIGIKAEA